jgi:hypothetical protein
MQKVGPEVGPELGRIKNKHYFIRLDILLVELRSTAFRFFPVFARPKNSRK